MKDRILNKIEKLKNDHPPKFPNRYLNDHGEPILYSFGDIQVSRKFRFMKSEFRIRIFNEVIQLSNHDSFDIWFAIEKYYKELFETNKSVNEYLNS